MQMVIYSVMDSEGPGLADCGGDVNEIAEGILVSATSKADVEIWLHIDDNGSKHSIRLADIEIRKSVVGFDITHFDDSNAVTEDVFEELLEEGYTAQEAYTYQQMANAVIAEFKDTLYRMALALKLQHGVPDTKQVFSTK